MKFAARAIISMTAFTLAGQALAFVMQMVMAETFGAKLEMDSFLAATTIPQYVTTIVTGALGSVLIPVFVDYKTKGLEGEAYKMVSVLINGGVLLLGLMSLGGMFFAKELLSYTNPGLSAASIELANRLSMVIWPTIVPSTISALLLSVHQSERQFIRQSAIVFAGGVLNLSVLMLLASNLGVMSLAVASALSVVLQTILCLLLITEKGRYHLSFDWQHEGVRQVARLLVPLIAVGVYTKLTPLVDRYLASGLEPGTISHLSYAFRITLVVATFLSVGISTFIFPKMALEVSNNDLASLGITISKGLRILWMFVAPLIAVGFSMCLPIVSALLKRGEFSERDSVIVADMLKVYLFSLIGASLGTITGKILYVLRDTKTVALAGFIESMAYVAYTIALTSYFGATGVILGYVAYMNLSLAWQLIYIRSKTKWARGRHLSISFVTTSLAAILSGLLAYVGTISASGVAVQLLVGCLGGPIAYVCFLFLFRSNDLKLLVRSFSKT